MGNAYCVNCRKVIKEGEKYWQVLTVDSSGEMALVPTCSENCAKETQQKNADMHRRRLQNVENQGFQIMRWGKW